MRKLKIVAGRCEIAYNKWYHQQQPADSKNLQTEEATRMTLRQEAQEEKEKLKHMSWKDRIWYIWEYYKFHMLLILIALVILWIIGSSLYRQSFTTRLSMAVINDHSGGNSSTVPLMEGLREALDCGKKDLIEINEGLFVDTNEETMSQYSYASMAKIAALVSGGMLDIMITDEATIRHYENLDAYMDLSGLLPDTLYSQLEDQFLYVTTKEGKKIPAAVSLEDSSLKDDTGIVMDPPYLAVIANTQHKEDSLEAISYLFRSIEQ